VYAVQSKAFAFCTSLQCTTILGAGYLEEETFFGCSSLTNIFCPQVTSVDSDCFSDCESLQSFNFENLRYIGERAFSNCNSLTEIRLNGDAKISARAFEDCGKIQKITLSRPVLKYESYAFSGCTALQCIEAAGVCYEINDYAFIHDPNVPSCVKTIYASAFSCFDIRNNKINAYHNNGRYVCIPEGIKEIGDNVFKDCADLEDVVIAKSVTFIGWRAFWGTKWLQKQRLLSKMVIINDILIDGETCEGEVVIPNTVNLVSGWAFANCFSLVSVAFSSNSTKIMEYAFRNCINLKRVIMDGEEYTLTGIAENPHLPVLVQRIFRECLNCFKVDENGLLYECTGNIERLILPKGIKSIGDGVFRESNLLTNIVLNDEVCSIGDSAFESCKWLVSVMGGKNVASIGKKAFRGCYALERIELSNECDVGDKAFDRCPALQRTL